MQNHNRIWVGWLKVRHPDDYASADIERCARGHAARPQRLNGCIVLIVARPILRRYAFVVALREVAGFLGQESFELGHGFCIRVGLGL